MRLRIDDRKFRRDMNNIINYSYGFIDGIKMGTPKMLQEIGFRISALLKEYVDVMARNNPQMLHHVYEWNQAGDGNARLFDVDASIDPLGITFKTKFLESQSVQLNSKVPFRYKAEIMERGEPVLVVPRESNVLKFEVNNETVYAPDAFVMNPGGEFVEGSFEKIVDEFFNIYLRQSFLHATGIADHFKTAMPYKQSFAIGARVGKSAGVTAGYRWVTNIKGAAQ